MWITDRKLWETKKQDQKKKKKKNCGPGESILIGGSGSEPVRLLEVSFVTFDLVWGYVLSNVLSG